MVILNNIKDQHGREIKIEVRGKGMYKTYWERTPKLLRKICPNLSDLYFEILKYPCNGKVEYTGRKKRFKNAETS